MAESSTVVKDAIEQVPQYSAWAEQTLKGRVQAGDTEQWSFGRPTNTKGAYPMANVDELDGFPVTSLGPFRLPSIFPPRTLQYYDMPAKIRIVGLSICALPAALATAESP